MTIWNFGVYADRGHQTVCYAATIEASTEEEAVAELRAELKLIPAPLYIGPLREPVLAQKIAPPRTTQATENGNVRLVRVDTFY